jgi:hypothetical protein
VTHPPLTFSQAKCLRDLVLGTVRPGTVVKYTRNVAKLPQPDLQPQAVISSSNDR